MTDLHLIPLAIRDVWLCTRCGRQIHGVESWLKRSEDIELWKEELDEWIIWLHRGGKLYVRCPQHATYDILIRTFGRSSKRTLTNDEIKQHDLEERVPLLFPPHLNPVPWLDLRPDPDDWRESF